jgi:hypothetical protein
MPLMSRLPPAAVLGLLAASFVSLTLTHAQSPAVPRSEHPRPDFMRSAWQTLNGRWEFEFDDEDRGRVAASC